MNFFIKQLNADAQDSAAATEEVVEATTAITNAPVEETTPAIVAEEAPAAPEVPTAPETPAVPEVEPAVDEPLPTVVAEVPAAPVQEQTAPAAEVAEIAAPEFVAAPETTEPVVAQAPVEEVIATAHDDFDWSVDKRNVSIYAKEEKEKYDKVYENTFVQIEDGEIINGSVVGLTKTDVVVNIGFKSDGLISLNEFRDVPTLVIGDIVEVMVVEKEDRQGNLTLSRKSARVYRAWQRIVEVNKTGEVVTGLVTSKTKGGLIVDVFGMETFLPGSQIDVKPVTDYDQFVGKTMEFKVVKINENIKNAVVSHKALIESDIEAQRVEIMSKLEKGQVLEGVVKNITDFGAFMDLGGLDGLLYITDISWGRISHPSEVLKMDQKLQVVVLDFDDDKKRISLGLKQLTPHPWDVLPAGLGEGSTVRGKVVNIEDYGAFLEVQPGVEGLVHVSEITWANTPVNAKEFFKLGDEHDAKVVTLDKDTRKMSLSIKQMTSDPWDTIENKYAVESKHKGLVKNITPYGVFVELEPGIGGMIHISDLSWLKRFNHPSDYVKVGEYIDIIIMGIDKDNRKLQLGHKQLEEDPWNTLEDTFGIGSKHEGTVTRRDDKGALVQLPYGLEGFAPARHLTKEDGKAVVAEETLPFIVIEFDRNEKRILLSHSRVWEQAQAEEKEVAKKEARVEAEKTHKEVKAVQAKVEKTTLGDLSALADIRAKLEEGEGKAK
ncbi:30S ribosomal protein S1 [Parasediminibacterium sp. JCM 36343]|uniref:30S ribosomal protein S1 n=1 Tax=Parasediminibacterium sp. JCM 36343 TaxID=3374279 RepID=UPI003979D1FB